MRTATWALCALAVSALTLTGTFAHAQCAGGRVATAATRGRCCWPGQFYSPEYGRCDGPPSCPAGLVASGNDCVAEPVSASPVVTTTLVPVVAYPTRRVRQPIWALAISGAALFTVMYVAHISVAVGIGSRSDDVGYQAIPFAGPWVCLAACSDPGDFIAALVASGVIQLAGLTMTILGLAVQVEHEVRAELDRGPRWALAPWATPEGAGLGFSLAHF